MFDKMLTILRDWATPPNPTPITVPHPNGHDAILLRQTGKGGAYDLVVLKGTTSVVPAHTFTSVPTFIAYLIQRASIGGINKSSAIVLVEERIRALAEDTGMEQPAMVDCALVLSQAWKPWIDVDNSFMAPQIAQRFLRSLDRELTGRIDGNGDDVLLGSYLLEQLATMTLIKSGDVKVLLTKNGFIRMRSTQDGREITANLPERFTTRLPVFRDLMDPLTFEPLLFDVNILVHTGESSDGLPTIAFELVRPYDILDLARQAVVEQLQLALGSEWLVGRGTPDVQFRPQPPVIPPSPSVT